MARASSSRPSFVLRTAASAAAIVAMAIPSAGLAAGKKPSQLSTKKSVAQALREADRARGFKKHSLAVYKQLKFLKQADTIKGVTIRVPTKNASNKALQAKLRGQFAKTDLTCLGKMKVQLRDVKRGVFVHRCSDDRLVLFVNQPQTTSAGVLRPTAGSGAEFVDGLIVVIAAAGIWAAFQETKFSGGELETNILCSDPGRSNLPECASKETSGGENGGNDSNQEQNNSGEEGEEDNDGEGSDDDD